MSQVSHDFDALTSAYAEAVLEKAPGRLAALYDADVRVFDAWDQWSYEGLEAWRPNLDQWLGSLGDDRVQACFEDVHASARGEMGFLTAIVTYTALDPGGAKLRSLQERLTWVLIRRGEGWAIAHQHGSFPTAFADQKAQLRRS